ncbi:MAG: DUF126 domain-containing protein [Rhodospirillaceae bacterium]|jgi:predicted aconitase with swiveling domain|nr:DUF126 domain-containing protein [Rhodospirillaceae bacterium]MBT5514311.1 DUF126 domain-containing protein [Rhodospirillaceae bacterium]MBT6085179.1 DUF126 domain-containing protein [Rhodospirillaceae bacterium]MBT6607411.1 DUF126 domain-containing protein [Rhodospirillaceae bacterium]MBT6883980.1 DUF126 domain-containing protein [Rhodospirillaceae bacterium]
MGLTLQAEAIIDGAAAGPVLRLAEPISFWGGVDPLSGKIIQPTHPDCGVSIAGKVLVLPGTIGSSSSSAIMLELIREGMAPAAIILSKADAILALGAVVAGELELPMLPVLRCDIDAFETGQWAEIAEGGIIRLGEAD